MQNEDCGMDNETVGRGENPTIIPYDRLSLSGNACRGQNAVACTPVVLGWEVIVK